MLLLAGWQDFLSKGIELDMANLQKIENLCSKISQNYKEWDKEREEQSNKVKREGDKPEKENEYKIEEERINRKFLFKKR